jgi:hypothetical protein
MFLHSKLVKKKKSSWLVEWSTHPRTSFFKRKMVSLSWVTCLSFFFLKKIGLFSRATCPHSLNLVYFQGWPAHTLMLVYFQGRPAHTLLPWSIFRGDQLTHFYPGLFSRVTCPHILTLVYFHGWLALLIGLTWDPIWRSPLTRTKVSV